MSRMRIGRLKLKEGQLSRASKETKKFQDELRDYHSKVRYWNENRSN